MEDQGMSEHLRRRVIDERDRRNLSARDAAQLGGISNTAWSRYESGGPLTTGIRAAVARAFDWPADWAITPSSAPADTATPSYAELLVRLEALEAATRELQAGQPSPRARRSTSKSPRS